MAEANLLPHEMFKEMNEGLEQLRAYVKKKGPGTLLGFPMWTTNEEELAMRDLINKIKAHANTSWRHAHVTKEQGIVIEKTLDKLLGLSWRYNPADKNKSQAIVWLEECEGQLHLFAVKGGRHCIKHDPEQSITWLSGQEDYRSFYLEVGWKKGRLVEDHKIPICQVIGLNSEGIGWLKFGYAEIDKQLEDVDNGTEIAIFG